MKKFLQTLMLAAVLLLPWAVNAQSLSDYQVTVDQSSTTFTSIASTGTVMSFTSTDDGYAACTVPFAFPFGESFYNAGFSVAASGNGFLYLNTTSCSGTTASSTGTYNVINAFLGQDGHMGRYSGVSNAYYEATVDDNGDSCFIIEFKGLGRYSSPYGFFTYQVVLYPTGNIDIVFDSLQPGTTTDTYRTFLRDGANNDNLFLSGSWSAPMTGTSAATMPTTGLPTRGTRIRFTRPVVTCPKPANFTFTNLTAEGADVSWLERGTATSWVFEYADSVIVPGTGNGTVINATDTVVSLTGLTPNTRYYVYVHADCGGDTSLNLASSFQTACVALTADDLPWNYGFEDATASGTAGQIDQCLYRGTNSTSAYPYPSTSYSHSGSYSLYYYASTTLHDYLCLPLTEDSIYDLQVRFWAKRSSTSYTGKVIVGVMSNPADFSTFVGVDTVYANDGTNWSEFEVNLNGYHGPHGYVTLGVLEPLPSEYSYNYVYIDDITLAHIPSCLRPDNFVQTGISANSISLAWQDTIGDAWEVIYGPAGFNPYADNSDNENIILLDNIYEDSVEVTDLYDTLTYDFYVRTVCSDGNSEWRGPVSAMPGSMDLPVSGTYSIAACGLTIFDDGGANGTYSANCNTVLTIYPSTPDSVVVISGMINGLENNYDYLRIYEGTSAMGTPLFESCSSNALAINPIISSSGALTVKFTSDGSGQYAGFVLNVSCIAAPECTAIKDLEVSHVAATSAFASWDVMNDSIGDVQSFNLEIVDLDNNATSTLTSTTKHALLTGLTPFTNYRLRVQTECADAASTWDSVSFRTNCLAGGNIEVSDQTTNGAVGSNYTIPVNNFYGYTLSEQIVLASELNGAGPISAISFEYNGTASTAKTDCYIYVGHTTAANSSALPASRSYMSLVYSGAMNCTSGWNTFNFDSVFNYNGTDNLVICVLDNNGDYDGTECTFKTHNTSASLARAYYADGSAPTMSTAATSTYTYRSNMRLQFPCESSPNACVAANAILVEIGSDDAEVIWAAGNGESSWEVAHKLVSENDWTIDATATSATSYTFTNLLPAHDYMFRVSHVCGGETYARIVTGSTVCVPVQVPLYENFETWTASSAWGTPAAPCWTKYNDYTTSTSYPYVTTNYGSKCVYFYGPSSGGTTGLILPAIENGIDSLQISFQLAYSSTGYGVTVGVMSDPANLATFTPVANAQVYQASVWNNFEIPLSSYQGSGKYIAIFPISGSYNYCYLDNIEVTYIPTCPRPTNVVASNMTQTSANIAWVDSATTEFEVEFGPAGFAHGQGTVVSVSGATTTTLTGLQHSTVYDVYVRGICSGYDTSSWSFVTHFVTACGALDVFPFTETFDNWGTGTTVHAPQCWTYGSDYSTTYPYISTTHNSGVGSMYFYDYNGTNSTAKTWLMMPAIDTTIVTMNQMMVSFNIYASNSSYRHPLAVGVSSVEGDMSTFVAIDTIYPVYGEWNFHEVYFDQYAGTGKYVTFAAFVAPGESYSYPYLDDVTLEMIPSCPRPDHLTASNATSSTVDFGWNDRGTASNWIIEYGPQGFEPGTGTSVLANSNPFTVTNMPASYVGEYYVRALCGVGDTSPYSRQSCLFSTAQVPAAVPYSYDFENAAEFANWQQSTNPSSDVHWVRGTVASSTLGTGSNGMFCTNDDSTAAYVANVTNASIYRDIDFGTTDSSFIIGFDAYMGGSPDAAYDGLMVFLVDPSVPVVSTDANITTPWGNVNDLYRIAQVRYTSLDNNGWTRFEGTFDNLSGVHRVAFFWFHQGATTNFVGDMAMVDNISIDYASCPRPTEVQATNVTATNATLTWRGPSTANYEVIYRIAGGQNNFVPTTTNSITLNNLQANSTYYVWVRKVCGAGDTSLTSDLFTLATPQILAPLPYFCGFEADEADECGNWGAANNGANDWYIGTATADSGSYSLYISNDNGSTNNYDGTTAGYSYAYRDFSFGNMTAQDTVVISFDWRCNGESSFDYLKVFFGQLNDVEGVLGSGTDYQPENTMDLSGAEYGFTGGRMNLQTSYTTSTWMIPGDQITPGNNRLYFCWRNDGSVTNNPAISIDNLSVIAPGASCGVPVITNVTNDFATATISWTGAGNDYEVAIKAVSEGMWPAETAVQGYTHTFTGLVPSTEYQFRVRQNCDTIGYSDWAMGTFTTDSLPCFAPTALAANNIEGTSVDLTWTAGGAETQWMVKVWNTTYADSVIANSTSTSINGLVAATAYQAAVKAICGNGAAESDWSEPISFTTATCAPVSGVQAGNITANSASISWTNNGTATQWEIEYGMAGFGQGEGTTITANANPTTLTGLESELQYDVYVRAICGENWVSEWATKVTFTTTGGNQQGIDNVEGMNVAIYPNPTSGATTISLSGVEGEVSLVIVDMSGRRVMSDKMECSSADCVKTINVENLAQGAYFVRIQGQNTNMVKKLIVK